MNDDAGRLDRIMVWGLLRDFFAVAKDLVDEATNVAKQRSDAKGDDKAAVPPPKGGAPARTMTGKGPSPAYVRKRQAVRETLEARLRPTLEKQIGARQTYAIAIALTAHVDERERTALGDLATEWSLPTLQEELVQIDDGGDRFFDQIDQLLKQRDTNPIVYEAFLLCLRAGFVGRWKRNTEPLGEYEGRLRTAIQSDAGTASATARPPAPAAPRRAVAPIPFPVRTYLVALGAVLLVAFALRAAGFYSIAASSVGTSCSAEPL